MPKLSKVKYYKPNGESGIASYTISIAKTAAEKAGFNENDKLVVKGEKGKIIIEKEK